MTQEIIEAVREIEREKGIETGTLVAALEDALLAAYKKTPGAARHATVELDDSGDFRVFSIELPEDLEQHLLEEARERKLDELESLEVETGERSHTLVSDDDLELDWSEVPESEIKRADVTPENFGRIAAQTAKQVILQRIREAERAMMYDEYVDRVGEVVTGIVQQAGDRNNVLVDLGRVEALLPRSEQVDGERYEQGSRIKAVITEVRSGTKGPQVILSRRDPELIKTLFELEVPEIADGLVEIRGVAREPGYRSKIAVESHAQGVDPVGACVGPRGSRVRMVVSELRGEKIDIIPWNTGAGALRRQGALAGARARGLRRRRDQGGDRRRPRRPARARDRQGGPERPPRRAAHRLEGRHPVRHRVRPGRGRGRVRRRRRRGVHRPLRRDPLERQALPERRAARLALLRRRRAPGARGHGAAGRVAAVGVVEVVDEDGVIEVEVVESVLEPARISRPIRSSRPRKVLMSTRTTWKPSKRRRPSRVAEAVAEARGRGSRVAALPVAAPRRTRALPSERADQDVHGLRAQGAAGRAPALRRAGRGADARLAAARPRRLHLPAAACFERAVSQTGFNRALRRTVAVEPGLARLYTGTDG